MKLTEAQLESAIIELLGAEGYPHVLGEAIERQTQDVHIKVDLRTFLELAMLMRESKRAAEATIRKFWTTASAGNSYNLFAIA